jgi:hypothetical protein
LEYNTTPSTSEAEEIALLRSYFEEGNYNKLAFYLTQGPVLTKEAWIFYCMGLAGLTEFERFQFTTELDLAYKLSRIKNHYKYNTTVY